MKRVFLPLDIITKTEELLKDETDGGDKKKRILIALYNVIDNDLTKTQKSYIILYYKYNMKIKQIAKHFEVDPSTVSRTIIRAKKKIFRLLKYI